VIDDDPDMQELLEAIFSHAQIDMFSAFNYEEAAKLLALPNARYIAALVDLRLPDKTGWEILKAIRETVGDDLPCIAITAYHTSKLREEALHAGFSHYLAKPINADELVEVIRTLIV
jgi:DNA-binding response OmpR family regulator